MKTLMTLGVLVLASSAYAERQCTSNGKTWVREENLGEAAKYCYEDSFKKDLLIYASLRIPAGVLTEHALGIKGPNGFHELNGLMKHRPVRLISHAVLPVGLSFWARHLERKGHPKGAKILRRVTRIGMAIDITWDLGIFLYNK